MFSKLFCCAAMLFFVTVNAYAQPEDGFTIVGIGASSCGKYLEIRSKMKETPMTPESVFDESFMSSWVQGCVSGMNIGRAISKKGVKMLLLPDIQSTMAYLDKFCQENPLEKVHTGVLKLYIDIGVNSQERQ